MKNRNEFWRVSYRKGKITNWFQIYFIGNVRRVLLPAVQNKTLFMYVCLLSNKFFIVKSSVIHGIWSRDLTMFVFALVAVKLNPFHHLFDFGMSFIKIRNIKNRFLYWKCWKLSKWYLYVHFMMKKKLILSMVCILFYYCSLWEWIFICQPKAQTFLN